MSALLASMTLLFIVSFDDEQPVEVFTLAVGVTAYVEPSSAEEGRGFGRAVGAWSATRVARALAVRGTRFAVELLADEGRYVTREDVLHQLDRVLERAQRSANPLVVYYFGGHGVSEGFGWNLFSIPGDELVPIAVGDVERLAQRYLHAAQIVDVISAADVPFLVLFDHCSDGESRQLVSGILSEEALRNISSVADILRHMNEFRMPSPVFFSTDPGSVVSSVADPRAEFSDQSIGPLARRLLLVLEQSEQLLSMERLVSGLLDPSLDADTAVPVTHTSLEVGDLVLAGKRAAAPVERLFGSGRED